MKTQFAPYLNEGLIKLPPKLLDEVTNYFVYWYLAYLQGKVQADKSLDPDDQAIASSGVKQLIKKFGVKAPSDVDVKKASKAGEVTDRFKIDDLPSAYLTRLSKMKGPEALEHLKGHELEYTVAFKKHPRIGKLVQGVAYDDAEGYKEQKVFISVPNMPVSQSEMITLLGGHHIAELTRRIENTIGIIEHEITHVVQNLVLKLLHPKQDETTGKASAGLKGKEAKTEAYYTSQAEFDPWVKTSIRHVNSLIGHSHAQTNVAKQKEIIKRFTFSDVRWPSELDAADDGTEKRSPFFKALRRSDMPKWRKAVKLLTAACIKEKA